jgi:signal transduction histidine kinase
VVVCVPVTAAVSLGVADATNKPHFKVSPKVLGPLGAEQLQDPALAVLELIKNSWDADATKVRVNINQAGTDATIVVDDNGHGMERSEFIDRWLIIGDSAKRRSGTSERGRPLIGEKGLGRLASFALANSLELRSARSDGKGFHAKVDWSELLQAAALEDYEVSIRRIKAIQGTRVELAKLKSTWSEQNTSFLVAHAELLASVPGERFRIELKIDGKLHRVKNPISAINELAEATMLVEVGKGGVPKVTSAVVNGSDQTGALFRDMKADQISPNLEGVVISLAFFLRTGASKRLTQSLKEREVNSALERHHGIRIYRDGINVPPYGINGDDWAGLERQRTSTGGPTMVPGNSQLIGSVGIQKNRHPQFVITAGRSGFSDQSAVIGLANYVKWAVRELGSARRGERLKIPVGQKIPKRVDDKDQERNDSADQTAASSLARIAALPAVKRDSQLSLLVQNAAEALRRELERSDEVLRLYAQLASTGIAATSFVHELRSEFDVVSDTVSELKELDGDVDNELVDLLNSAWRRILSFAALFKVVPLKLRRKSVLVGSSQLQSSIKAISGLAPPDQVKVEIKVPDFQARIVPAEFDSVVLNLISNAVKAVSESKQRAEGRIRVTAQARGIDLRVTVADNGVGVAKQFREVIFEPLEGKFREGTGMGLPIVAFIVGRYKGSVVISDDPPNGFNTEFVAVFRGVIRNE